VPAKFVIRKGKKGEFSFALLAANGQTIVTSESYATRRAAMNGIKSVQKYATTGAIDDLTVDAAAPAGSAARTTAAVRPGSARSGAATKKPTAKKSAIKKPAIKKPVSRTSTGTAKKASAGMSAPGRAAGPKKSPTVAIKARKR
jgi:uncharacterized protein YegP (UPF0339 family)